MDKAEVVATLRSGATARRAERRNNVIKLQRRAAYLRAAEGVLLEGWWGVYSAVTEARYVWDCPEIDLVVSLGPRAGDAWFSSPPEDRAMLLLLAWAITF